MSDQDMPKISNKPGKTPYLSYFPPATPFEDLEHLITNGEVRVWKNQLDRIEGSTKTNRNLIKGLSQRIDRLERGDTTPTPPHTIERRDDV